MTPDPQASARVDQELTAARILAMAFEYPTGYRVERHHHERCQLLHASAGVMRIRTDGATWLVPTQRAVWVPAGLAHAVRMSGAVSMRTLYLRREVAAQLPTACRVIAVTPLLRELILRSVELGPVLVDDTGSPGPLGALVGLLLEELARCLEDPLGDLLLPWPRDPRLERVAAALVENPGDRRSRTEWGRVAGASARTLGRLFAAETGMSFTRWRQILRLQAALELLARGDSVTQVALAVGYESVSAFITMFRLSTGMTPAASARSMNAGARGVLPAHSSAVGGDSPSPHRPPEGITEMCEPT